MRSLFNKYVFNLDWRRTGKMPTVVKLWRSIKDTVYYHCYYKHTKKHKQDLEDVRNSVLAVRDRVLPHLLIMPTCPHCDESFQVQSLNRTRDLWKCRSCKVEFTPER